MASISTTNYFEQSANHSLHEQVIYDIVLSRKRLSYADNARVHIRTLIDRQNLSWISISCKKTFSNLNNSKVLHINFTLRKKILPKVSFLWVRHVKEFSFSNNTQNSVPMTGNFWANIFKQVSTVLSMACQINFLLSWTCWSAAHSG